MSKGLMWEKNISQESMDSNINMLVSKKLHGHRGTPALTCPYHYGSLTRASKPASGLAQPLQGFLMIFTKCIMNANSAIFYTRVSSHLTTRDTVNSTLEYITDISALS